MDIILQKFAGKIDTKSLLSTVEELRVEYIDDGLTKEDVPPILGRLMMESVKFKKLPGPIRKNSSSLFSIISLKKLMKVKKIVSLRLF